jgi:hypothetical protein
MGGFDEQKFVGENWANNEQVKNGYAEIGEEFSSYGLFEPSEPCAEQY